MFFFALLCMSGRPDRVTLIFKNTKNRFLSLLVSVWPLALYDTYFHVIQKTPKYTKFSKCKNINISKRKRSFFKNYVILDSSLWDT